ncbi:MAG TPA: hypothetical protein VH300_08850 [Thermoleophilaceae bacterium]|jgi:hypothetical protein|nr:hypothetical protein [Thermoleophilaceae bacterium]
MRLIDVASNQKDLLRAWQYDTWSDQDQESNNLQGFPKRLMGLEPTTFCMAIRT